MSLPIRCTWQEDLSFMRPAVARDGQRWIAPCLQPAVYVSKRGTVALCQHHYDGKVYRKEDVSEYSAPTEQDWWKRDHA